MSATSEAVPASPALLRPVGWVGRSVLAVMSYLGGVALLSLGAVAWLFRPRDARSDGLPSFGRTMVRQVSWMLALGLPLVGLVHIAMGSFLSLQAYYGSTFVDGTGAVVGVGLLRNLGGLMTGMILAGNPGRADDSGAAPPGPAGKRTASRTVRCRWRSGWPARGSPRPRSPACCSRSGGSRSARWSAGRRRSR